MTQQILVTLMIFAGVSGCGDVNVNGDPSVNVGSEQAAATSSWTDEEKAEIREECEKETNVPPEAAPAFCKCYVDAVSVMTDHKTFSANKGYYHQQMESTGGLVKCSEMAGLKAPPEPTKIRVGMTKAQVQKILGDPSTVSISYVGSEEWKWIEAPGMDKICFPRYKEFVDNQCSVQFMPNLIRQEGIKSEFVDLTN